MWDTGEVMLPAGVTARALERHPDARGSLTEVYRRSWAPGVSEAVQWNLLVSACGSLRGMRVHVRHDDWVVVFAGRVRIGLRDVRRGSPSFGQTAMLDARGAAPQLLTVPRGVAHGFYFVEDSSLLVGVSEYWDVEDELECAWDDPALELSWGATPAALSERDRAAQSLAALMVQLERYQPFA
jgi:dTDP-4-dehydrorhamnose 3,5-epimerase